MDKETKGQGDKGTKGQIDKRTKGQRDKRKKGQRENGTKGQREKIIIKIFFEVLCCILGTCTFLFHAVLRLNTQESFFLY